MKLIKLCNKELFEQGAKILVDKIAELEKQKEFITFGLVGGRSVAGIYEELAKKDLHAWKKTHFFLIDERNVPIDDIESNYKLVREHLLNPLLHRDQICEENIHPINTSLKPELAIHTYQRELEQYNNFLDIAILSSGEDNHIGAIFPNKKYPEKEQFAYFNDSPKPPKERFTATPELLSKTSTAIVIFLGESKKDALKHFLDNNIEKTLPEITLQKIRELIILTNQVI